MTYTQPPPYPPPSYSLPPYPPPPYPPPPYSSLPTPPRHGLRAAVAVVTVLSLVTAAAAGLAVGRSLGAGTGEPAADALDRTLPRLVAFVEDARGLDFRTVPEVQVLDDADYDSLVTAEDDAADVVEGTEPHDYALTYEALRLTESAEDFTAAEEWGWTIGSIGFYDPSSKELIVRGTTWTPSVELTVVHELTHALQDQHFDLTALGEAVGPTDDDAWLALSGLIEGDAVHVEEAYIAAQSEHWYETWLSEDTWGAYEDAPYDPLADALGALTYDFGYESVELLYGEGGSEAVDRAFRSPPTTSEQLAHAADWLDGDPALAPAADVLPPDPGSGEVVDRASLGVAALGVLASVDQGFFVVDPLEGWRGDSYVTWVEESGRACTAVTVVFDAAADAEQAVQALEAWLDLRQTEAEQSGTTLLLSSCGDPA